MTTISSTSSLIAQIRDKATSKFPTLFAAFQHFDLNKAGSITRAQLETGLRRWNFQLDEWQIQNLWAVLVKGAGGDGTGDRVTFNSFAGVLEPPQSATHAYTVTSPVGDHISARFSHDPQSVFWPSVQTNPVQEKLMIADMVLVKCHERTTGSLLSYARLFSADPDGTITLPAFRQRLTDFGIVLTDPQVEMLLSGLPVQNNRINVLQLVRALQEGSVDRVARNPGDEVCPRPANPYEVDLQELTQVAMRRYVRAKIAAKRANMNKAFLSFDLQRKGFISYEDFVHGLETVAQVFLTQPEYACLCDMIGKDGRITFHQFSTFMNQLSDAFVDKELDVHLGVNVYQASATRGLATNAVIAGQSTERQNTAGPGRKHFPK